LKDTNISGVAVISAIYGEDDIEEKTAALYKKVNKYFVK
jgi:thiamine monophosphate synthase